MTNQIINFKDINKALDVLKGFKIVKEISKDQNSMIIEATKKDRDNQIDYAFFIDKNERTAKMFEKKSSNGYCSTRQYSRKYGENEWKDVEMSKLITEAISK